MKKQNVIIRTIIIIIFCAIQLIPLYIIITVSLKERADLSSYWKLPAQPQFQNFVTALEIGGLFRAFSNTFIITFFSTLGVLVLGIMAAYPLSRNPSGFNKKVKTFILSMMMIPALSLLVPIYVLLLRLGGISRFHGIVPVHMAFNLPVAVYMFSNFIKTIPIELDEAALIDGCSVYSIFFRIIVPLFKPVIVSVIIFVSIQVWNDFQYALYFLPRPTMRVITLAIASYFSMSGSNPNVAAAMALLAILPVVLLFILLQKYFIKGAVDGAIK